MKTEDKEKVSDALSERSKWIKVGLIWVKVRPLTLWQIYEMGTAANEINGDDLREGEKINTIAMLLKHGMDAKAMVDVFCVCAFRKRWKRWLMKHYLKRRLTVEKFSELITILAATFNPNFFLTSIIFLTQTKIMTEPSQTTPLGQSSEE